MHFASLMYLCHLKNAELEPKFQKNVDTKHQLVISRVINLLTLCNICHFISPEIMAKRMQQKHGEERIVAKPKPTILVSMTEENSSTVTSPHASYRPGIPRAPSQRGLISQETRSETFKQRRSHVWQRHAKWDESKETPNFINEPKSINISESPVSTGKPAALTAEDSGSTVTTRCGRTISTHPPLAYRILKKFSRMCDKSIGVSKGQNVRSRCERVDMVNICERHLFKLLFISETITWRMYILPRINPLEH